jgi:hypothetical protein
MPVITAPTVNMGSQVVNEFVDTVNTSDTVFTLPDNTPRDTLFIDNLSGESLIVTINAQIVTIQPFKSTKITDLFTQFSVKSQSNLSSFRARSSYESADEADEKKLKDNILSDFPINIKLPPFNARGNANFFNSVDKKWYVDAGFKTLATDDTKAINDAIIFAATNKIKKVFLNDGNYLISNQIMDRSNVEFFGNKNNTKIVCSGSNAYSAIVNLDPVNGNNNMYIHDLIIDVQRDNRGIGADNASNGIRILSADANRCENVTIENVHVTGTGHAGMYLYNLKRSVIKNNKVSDTMRDGIVVWCNSEYVQILNNEVWDVGDDCIAVNSEVTGHQGTRARNIVINGGNLSHRVGSIYGSGVRIEGAEYVTVSNLNINNVQGHGVIVEDSFLDTFLSENVVIANNNITDVGSANSSGSGISVAHALSAIVKNNTITNAYLNAIQMTGDDTSCEGNIIRGGQIATTNGISIQGVGCSARNNEIYDVPNMGIDIANFDAQVTGNKIKDACLQSTNPYIRIAANIEFALVNSNKCRKTKGTGSYGVRISTGASDNCIVVGNLTRGFVAGNGVSNAGTGTNNLVANNI